MKVFLVIALLVVATFSAATNKSYEECKGKIDYSKCDSKCQDERNDKCGLGTDVFNSDECKDYLKEALKTVGKGEDEKWSEAHGEAFHGCNQNCIDELSGEAKKIAEKEKACSANVLSFAVALVAALALLL